MRVSIICAALVFCPLYVHAADNSPKPFPAIDPATQKARDDERKTILQDEMRDEVLKLNKDKSDLAAAQNAKRPAGEITALAESVHRHEANVAALNRELLTTGQQAKAAQVPVRLAVVKQQAPTPSKADAGDQPDTAPVPFWDVYHRQANNRTEGETNTKMQLTAN